MLTQDQAHVVIPAYLAAKLAFDQGVRYYEKWLEAHWLEFLLKGQAMDNVLCKSLAQLQIISPTISLDDQPYVQACMSTMHMWRMELAAYSNLQFTARGETL